MTTVTASYYLGIVETFLLEASKMLSWLNSLSSPTPHFPLCQGPFSPHSERFSGLRCKHLREQRSFLRDHVTEKKKLSCPVCVKLLSSPEWGT